MAVTISSPVKYCGYKSETETYSQEYFQNIPNRIETVVDAFRAAIFKVEIDSTTRISSQQAFTYNLSFRDVPEFFTKIGTPDVLSLFDFLINNNDLIDIISVACEKTVDRFGGNSQLMLEVCKEYYEEYLALYIRQEEYQIDLLTIIDELSQTFEDLLVDRSGWFMITTDFDPPKVI